MLMSTQAKALLLVAILCGARAARLETELNGSQKLRDLLQAHPDEHIGVAFEELAKVDDSISQLSGTCNKATLQGRMVSAALLLQKGQNLNWLTLAKILKDFAFIIKLIQSGCTMQDLAPGQWDSLKAAMQTHAPMGLPHGKITFNGVVADTFSLAVFGKLWHDQFPSKGMPSVISLPEGDASTTMDEANADLNRFEYDIERYISDISPHQVDPFNRPLVLLESGSNTSQLVSRSKWNPIAFVGGIVVGLIALIVTVICALLMIVSVVSLGTLNGVFGSIYCLIKNVIQMKDPEAETFLSCMKTNAIAQVLEFAWRCSSSCGVWGLIIAQDAFKLAFDIKDKQRAVGLDKTPPSCFK
mmetsp:Transcript_81209/g.161052  ORF Transcript_81209/g.161052 Transcript_81209/m.161052 type:complete len:357 (+) Transcript_81209:78-1148(+)|eukprot:CAMPEP_0172721796 /NCGR_PEP_ID=MMETSP1074-20121228/79900_1 /TAXON_ID=2916 /ORGANISM="Ceratium fusus, Strain PA161109" /LENGTH=356 /DNA_ID=CAMNT_0013547629 /DNA_START=72 /DNA_END=1142 /DNA_ORIENTATION=+